MNVMCGKRGIVAVGVCGETCSGCELVKGDDDPWGNPIGTCKYFRFIIRSEEEQQEMGVKMVYPNQPQHEKISKELEKSEERDVDHISKRSFPIAVPLEMPKLKPKKVA